MESPTALPQFAPFPAPTLRDQIDPEEWSACTAAWASLVEAHMALSDDDFTQTSMTDESIPAFLTQFSAEVATSGPRFLGSTTGVQPLLKAAFELTNRLLLTQPASPRKPLPVAVQPLVQWDFLADVSRIHPKRSTVKLFSSLPTANRAALKSSLSALKKDLTRDLDAGITTPAALPGLEARLDRLSFLLARDPGVASFFLAGSDFLDGLISCFRLMNPPLRRVLVTTTYLCVMGLVDFSGATGTGYGALTDQLYALKATAEAHKTGLLNANDSLVAELVTSTPLLSQLERKLDEAEGGAPARAKSALKDLLTFKKPGVGMKPPGRLARKRADKGKGVALDISTPTQEMHIHRMGQITQIQDLFPDLGSAFVAKLLAEYGDDQEQVVAHLLDDSLPDHLQNVDKTEELVSNTGHVQQRSYTDHLAPKSTPPPPQHLPARHNVFDDDELDKLAVDTARLHVGKQNPGKTADDILNDRSTAPNKAAILSALAAFDSDDDERDDTYDVEDVGGTVDSTNLGGVEDETISGDGDSAADEALFRTYRSDPAVFERDNAARRSFARQRLRDEAGGMTDEAIEGWALMLARNPQRLRRLEARFSLFTGAQSELAPTAWRASPAVSGAEDSDASGGGGSNRGRGARGRGRGAGRGGGGRGGAGSVAGPTGEAETEQARRRKEANKGSRANHNRRDQRARKMARGGFPG